MKKLIALLIVSIMTAVCCLGIAACDDTGSRSGNSTYSGSGQSASSPSGSNTSDGSGSSASDSSSDSSGPEELYPTEGLFPEYDDSKVMLIGGWDAPINTKEDYQFAKDMGLNTMFLDEAFVQRGTDDFKQILEWCDEIGLDVIITMGNAMQSVQTLNPWEFDDTDYTQYSCVKAFNYWDEPYRSSFPQLQKLAEMHKEKFGDKIGFYVNHYPCYVGSGIFGGTYEKYLSDYCKDVLAKASTDYNYLSADIYPLWNNNVVFDRWLDNISTVAKVSKDNNVKSHFFIQNTEHYNKYRKVTENDVRFQFFVNMAFGVQGMTYFTYRDSKLDTFKNSCVSSLKSCVAHEEYYQAQTVNAEIADLDGVYLNFDWNGTMPVIGSNNTSGSNDCFKYLNYGLKSIDCLQSVQTTEDALVGQFKDADGNDGLIVTNFTNPALNKTNNVTLTFKNANRARVYYRGSHKDYLVTDNQLQLTLQPGDGVFVIPMGDEYEKKTEGSELRIAAPTQTQYVQQLGQLVLPELNVITRENLIDTRYTVSAVSATGPTGAPAAILSNTIRAARAGEYTVVFGSSNGISNVTVKFDVADRTAPTLNIDLEKIPDIYCSGIEYELPTYTISGGPAEDKCYMKLFYSPENSSEREEIEVVNNRFKGLYDDGAYYIVIHLEDEVGNYEDHEIKVDAFEGIKEVIPDKVTYFDEAFGTTEVKMYWQGPNKLSYDREVSYEGDEGNGSLRVTAVGNQDWNYLVLSPWITDVSAYDYLEFYVYNPTEHSFSIEPGNCGLATRCDPGVWTRVVMPTALFDAGDVRTVSDAVMKKTDIKNFAIRFYGFNFSAGDYFNVSAIFGRKGEVSVPVDEEAIVRLFESRTSNITVTDNATIDIDTEHVYGEEKGSLQVTRTGSGEIYAYLIFPERKNLTYHDYIVYRVYNPTAKDVTVGWKWCGDTVAKAGEWTEVKVPVSVITEGKLVSGDDGKTIKLKSLRNPCLRIFQDGLGNGESLYFSAVYATVYTPEGVYMQETTVKTFTGKTEQLVVMRGKEDITAKVTEWSSEDTSVATVSESGLVTGVGRGETVITVKVDEETEFEVSVFVDADGVVANFNSSVVGMTPFKGVGVVTRDETTHYEDETASMKVLRSKTGEIYVSIDAPATADLTNYKYLVFRVYNPTALPVKTGIMWYGETQCLPGEWTQVVIDLDAAFAAKANDGTGMIDDVYGKDISRSNVKGLGLRIMSGLAIGESIYVSNVVAKVHLATLLDQATGYTIYAGETKELTLYQDGIEVEDKTSATWSSDNEEVATVVDGVVTAKQAGKAYITVTTAEGDVAKIAVTVENPISLSQTEVELYLNYGEDGQLTVLQNGADYEGEVTWQSGDESIVTVEGGVITAVAAGKTTVTATVDGKGLVANVTVYEDYLVSKYEKGASLTVHKASWAGSAEASVTDEVCYGSEETSVKVVGKGSGEIGIRININAIDLTKYRYLVFRVYNATPANTQAGVWWAGDTICPPGEWTEIKIDLTKNIDGKDKNYLYLRVIDVLPAGQVVYFSNVYAIV